MEARAAPLLCRAVLASVSCLELRVLVITLSSLLMYVTSPILYWIDILYLFQATEYAEVPLDEAVPFTTLVKVEALDLLGGQLGPDPEVCFLILYSALTELAVVVDEQQRDPLLCGCPGLP